MKNLISLFLFSAFAFVYFAGCDSSSNSVAIPTSIPELVSPVDGDTMVSLNPTFRWNNTGNKIEISWNPNFSTIFHSATVSGQYYTISTSLETGRWYWWHIGHSEGQNITWSTTWKFRTHP
jgi:hypothetical protein